MEKRIFLAVLISLAVLWSWAALAPKLFPELVKKPAPQTQTAAPAQPSTNTSANTSTAAAPSATTETAAPAPVVPAPAPVVALAPVTPISASAITLTTVDAPEFTARFSNRAAELVSFQLKSFKAKNGKLVELVKGRDPTRTDYPLAIESAHQDLARQVKSALYPLTDHTDATARVLSYPRDGTCVLL